MRTLLCWLAIVIFGCSLALTQPKYKVLWSFSGSPDGAYPFANLAIDAQGNLYGTTLEGGSVPECALGCGTVFRLSPNPDGTWSETILYSFCSVIGPTGCEDGEDPKAGVVLDGKGNIYGTTFSGGTPFCAIDTAGCGVVFELSPPAAPGDSWTETVLYNFCSDYINNTCMDGAFPTGQLVFDNAGNLYGTTTTGGAWESGGGCCFGGTVFELLPRQSGWTENVLYSFCAERQGIACQDGAGPQAAVTFDSGGNLYGTTEGGGAQKSQGLGTVFQLSPGPQGWTHTILYSFSSPYGLHGANPTGPVSFDSSGNIYGTVSADGQYGLGGVFRLSPSQRNEFTLSFKSLSGPNGGVLIDSRNSAVYGTATGSNSGSGGVFRAQGKNVTTLYTFTDGSDGGQPVGSLIADSGDNDYGVVFEVSP